MNRSTAIRVAGGALLWVGLLVLLAVAFAEGGGARRMADKLLDYAVSSPRRLVVRLPAGSDLRPGDPVFVSSPGAFLTLAGRVRSVAGGDAVLEVFPEYAAGLAAGLSAEVFEVPDTVAWIVSTLVPPERGRELKALAAEFVRREGAAIRDTLLPEIHRALADVVALYEEDVPAAIARHRGEIDAILDRHRSGVVEERLVPAVKAVGGRLASEKFGPLIEEVADELLQSLPVWSLGWRFLWERVPFTEEDQVRKRFEKYVREQAAPILAARTGRALELAGEVLAGVVGHPEVRAAAAEVVKTVADDPEVTALLRRLFDELVVDNDRLADVLRRRWEEGFGAAIGSAAARTEPLVKSMVDAIVLNEERSGLSPRFSHVLRTRVFWKDRRFVRLIAGNGAPLPDGAVVEGIRPDV